MSKLIALDAGHGLYTPGKRCLKSLDPDETREWSLNSRIATMVQNMLKSYDCEVVRVDDITGAYDVERSERCAIANASRADIYVSIHHNAGAKGSSSGGTVVYHYSNHPEIAELLYKEVTDQTGLYGNRCNKIVKYGYDVLVQTRMEAVLIENGFMDSKVDTPIILTDEHAEKTAKGIVNFLIKQLGLKKVTQEVYLKIPFDSIKNAMMLQEYLNAAGYEVELVH